MELDYSNVNILSAIEEHTSAKLRYKNKQWVGACPFDDCSGDDDGFIVWPEGSKYNNHFLCRTCRRSGDIVKLIREVSGKKFLEICSLLGIPNPYKSDGTCSASPQKTEKREPTLSEEAKAEILLLSHSYPRFKKALQDTERAKQYLAERCVALNVAERYGLAYVPPAKGDTNDDLRKWCERVIFPVQSKHGLSFIGRSLALWKPGMNENEHKELLKLRNIPRWMFVKDIGTCLFHTEALGNEHITLVEGPFDALALLANGLDNVVAVCGKSVEVQLIPATVFRATIAFDGDISGQDAARDWTKKLNRLGIETTRCTPPDDGKGKDWSERYRLHGRMGLTPLLNLISDVPVVDATPVGLVAIDDNPLCFECVNDDRETVGNYSDSEGLWHCEKHWQELPINQRTLEQVKHSTHRLASSLPGKWTVSEPMRCTPRAYIEKCKAELDEETIQRKLEAHPTPESYWTNVKRKLANQGYYEMVARDNARIQDRLKQYRATWFSEVAA